jgi:hypothetical protein
VIVTSIIITGTIPIPTETSEPLPVGEQSWRWCPDCHGLTSGMCWRHSTRYLMYPVELIPVIPSFGT